MQTKRKLICVLVLAGIVGSSGTSMADKKATAVGATLPTISTGADSGGKKPGLETMVIKKPIGKARVANVPRVNTSTLIAPAYTGDADPDARTAVKPDPKKPGPAHKAAGRSPKILASMKGGKSPGKDVAGSKPTSAPKPVSIPGIAKPLTVPMPGAANVVGSIARPRMSSSLLQRQRGVGGISGLRERMAGLRAKSEFDQLGLGPDLDANTGVRDPATGETFGFGRSSALDGLPGDPGIGKRGGRASAATNPLTGRSLLGGDPAAGGDDREQDAHAAARQGKGMAMDDGEDSTTGDTQVFGAMTFDEAHTMALGQRDGLEVPGGMGASAVVQSGTSSDGQRGIFVTYRRPGQDDATVYYAEGEKPAVVDDRPAPDDAGSGDRKPMTAEEQKQMEQEIREAGGIAVNPAPDGDRQGGGTGGDGEVLTDLDLAGQPVDDESGEPAPAGNPGTIPSDLGLAGQPVDDDPDFGGVQLGGFGSALVHDARLGMRVPVAEYRAGLDGVGERVEPRD